MFEMLKKFRRDESGAVTVDWVVLTAGVVALAVAAIVSIETGAVGLTDKTGAFMATIDPAL